MSGIYIHIPYCKKKCHYCNFFSVAHSKYREEFIKALLKEIELQKDYLRDEIVNTIYFGGGTPSILPPAEIQKILEHLVKYQRLAYDVEITLEANPDDVTPEYLHHLKKTPVNRLSLGVQSFFDEDLAYLNRIHSAEAAKGAIFLILDSGYSNLTIDLIYGIPTLTTQNWQKNLEIFLSYPIPHLSAYALTVEQKTPLSFLIEKGKLKPVDEEQSVAHFKILMNVMHANDFIHYEISNFSKEGFYSRHNSLYWLGGHYLGLGPSAHSFNGYSRQWNVSSLTEYIKLEDHFSHITEKEVLTPEQRYNEYIMTSLRTVWGCDAEHIRNVFGDEWARRYIVEIKPFIGIGQVRQEGSRYFLTDAGKLFADHIASSLFHV